jgi:hypothetical protein
LICRFDQKDKDEIAAQIEDAIYCRRVTEARRKLDILKSTTRDNQHEEE